MRTDGTNPTGFVDSIYCGSGVDGRGLRCVVFFSGCNLRCPFCHNPETLYKKGEERTADEVVARTLRYRPYFRRGGVTLSGGEPFLQREFAAAVLTKLKERGIDRCAETNGTICDEELISLCDTIVADVKNQESDDLSAYEIFFEACVRQRKEVRMINVLVPGKNDTPEKIAALKALADRFSLSDTFRFLPFRKLCADKYRNLGRPFPYGGIREAEERDLARAKTLFSGGKA